MRRGRGGNSTVRESAGVAAASLTMAAVRRYGQQPFTELATLFAARGIHEAVKLYKVLLSFDRAKSTLVNYGSVRIGTHQEGGTPMARRWGPQLRWLRGCFPHRGSEIITRTAPAAAVSAPRVCHGRA